MFFPSLQTLRGLFALAIFFHHFSWAKAQGIKFDAGGDMGVAFFFILSGFVMTQSYIGKLSAGNPRVNPAKFVVKRLSKIYPLYVVCLAGAAILNASFGFFDLCNLLLLQAWIPLEQSYFSGNAVSWCLSDFLFFYSIFPFLCMLLKSNRGAFLKVYLAILFIYIVIVMPAIPSRFVDGIAYVNPLTRLLDFIFGMLLSEVFITNKAFFLNRKFPVKIIDAFVILAITTFVWYTYHTPYNLSILWWPSLALLLLAVISSCNRILTSKPLVKFGDVSFSFYLIHVLSIQYLDLIFLKLSLDFEPTVRFVIIFSLTIIFSFAVHYCFVVPVERYIRRNLV